MRSPSGTAYPCRTRPPWGLSRHAAGGAYTSRFTNGGGLRLGGLTHPEANGPPTRLSADATVETGAVVRRQLWHGSYMCRVPAPVHAVGC